MFGTIRKHQSWLWIFIIAVTILGMIVWTNNTGSNNQRGPGNFGSIDNKAITATEMHHAENDVILGYFAQSRPHQLLDRTSANVQRQAYQQLFVQRKMAQYNLHADPDSAARLASAIISQWDEGRPASMDDILKFLKSRGFTAEDFEHYLENEVAFRQLETVVGLSGKVVTPDEIKSLYAQNYQDLSVEAVFFNASNLLSTIATPTAEVLGQFYTNQQATYREPDKMQLSYVYFNATNFMSQAEQTLGTNLTREVEDNLSRFGTNILQFGKTTEEARAKIRELLILQTAQTNALAAANALQRDVVSKQTNYLQNLTAAAKAKGLEIKETKPFDKQYGPSELNLSGDYPASAFFDLTADIPLMPQPLSGMDGAYVVALDKFIPSHVPPLSEIRSRVEHDYKFQQALHVTQLNGQSFAQTATNELAHGKTFAQTSDSSRLTPVQVPPFSRATTRLPEVEDRTADFNDFKNVAFATPVGGVSRFIDTSDGGFVIHVKQQLPLDEAKMATQLPEFTTLLRERRQNEVFQIWFGSGWIPELNRGLRDVSVLHRQD